MSEETLWPAPAKLNLFLHILGRRPDGYHDLQTLFQLIDLQDTVAITVTDDGRIGRAGAPIAGIEEADDLTLKAASALKGACGTSLGATIRLEKRIPLGGGLGGGSSDAATVLVALNRLWNAGLSAEDLAALGLRLGADIPVFVHGSTAWGEGLGERLVPVELPERWFVIVHPGVCVATREVFQAPELTRNSPPLTIQAFLQAGGRNDCEGAVRARFPEVAQALEWLGQFAAARLTGTGACVFASFETADEARRVVDRVPVPWKGFVARGINISPLCKR